MNNFVNGSVERIEVESMDYNKHVFTEQSFVEHIAEFAKTFADKVKPFKLHVSQRPNNLFMFDVVQYGNDLSLVQQFYIKLNKFKQAEWVKLV